MEVKSKVLHGLRWTAGGKAASQLVSWAITLIVVRLLSPQDYGLIAMATVFIAFCLLLNELGLGAALVQAKDLTDRIRRQAFGLVLSINLSLFLILILASPLIADFFDEQRLRAIVPILALQFMLMSFYVIPNSQLQRDMNFKAISVVGVVADLSNGLVTLILALAGMGVWSLVIGSLSGILVRVTGLNIASPFLKRPSFDFRGFRDYAKFGGYISLNRILWYLYSQADVFIIGKVLGKTILGYYSIAMHIASLPMNKVASILNQVGLPAYSKLQDNKELAASYAIKVTKAIGFVAMPVFFGISSVSPELVEVVLGDKWLQAILPLQLLSLIVPLRTLSISLAPAVSGLGRPDVNVKTLAMACVIMPTSFFIGVHWGLKGVSLAWIIGYSIWFFSTLFMVAPVIGMKLRRFFGALAGPALMGGVMYAAVTAARWFFVHWHVYISIALPAMIVVGAIFYAGGMWLFFRSTAREVWAMRR